MENKIYPFPQADDINKVIKIIYIPSEEYLRDTSYLMNYLGLTNTRQISYYISACQYIKLITDDKCFTIETKRIRSGDNYDLRVILSRLIASDNVFGQVYFMSILEGELISKNRIIKVMKEYINFNSDELYNRRAHTVENWVKWIIGR